MAHADDRGFSPLPHGDDSPRLCGVEIEFSGLTEAGTARIVAATLGGTPAQTGAHDWEVPGTAIGTIRVELDIALRKSDKIPMLSEGLDVLRGLVPVEIVTDPLSPEQMPRLDALRETLREAGAEGSRKGVLLGFGVHLNPARVAGDDARPARIALAWGLAEDWLRAYRAIDTTRRLLPFVAPWPHSLTDDLVAETPDTTAALARLYARHTQSRNHGLDLLPLFKDADPDTFARLFPGDDQTGARPAYHVRLPDCRIDEPDWSLHEAWADWLRIERLADDADRLAALCEAWRAHRDALIPSRAAWADRAAALLQDDDPERAA